MSLIFGDERSQASANRIISWVHSLQPSHMNYLTKNILPLAASSGHLHNPYESSGSVKSFWRDWIALNDEHIEFRLLIMNLGFYQNIAQKA